MNFTRFLLPCRFLYDGNRIANDDTPSSLEMEDNGRYFLQSLEALNLTLYCTDTIDVMVERTFIITLLTPITKSSIEVGGTVPIAIAKGGGGNRKADSATT